MEEEERAAFELKVLDEVYPCRSTYQDAVTVPPFVDPCMLMMLGGSYEHLEHRAGFPSTYGCDEAKWVFEAARKDIMGFHKNPETGNWGFPDETWDEKVRICLIRCCWFLSCRHHHPACIVLLV